MLSPYKQDRLAHHRREFAQIPQEPTVEGKEGMRLMYETWLRLHSLHALKDDLDTAISLCNEFEAQILRCEGAESEPRANPLHPLHDGLLSAIVVAYGRVFTPARFKDSYKTLHDTKYDLSEGAGPHGALHQAILALRRKRFAHTDAHFKHLGATAAFERGDDGVLVATVSHNVDHITLPADVVPRIRELASNAAAGLLADLHALVQSFPDWFVTAARYEFDKEVSVETLEPEQLLRRVEDFDMQRVARHEALLAAYGLDERRLELFG